MSAREIFDACDTSKRGYLELEDLGRVCPDLNTEDKLYIFKQLDKNGDGRISREEFESGFASAIANGERTGYRHLGRRASLSTEPVPDSPVTRSPVNRSPRPNTLNTNPEIVYFEPDGAPIDALLCGDENVLSLYEQLQASGTSELLGKFEKVMGTFYRELKDQKEHNERLQTVYAKEKEQHSRYMGEVETELEGQLAAAEERARREERERLSREKEEMRQRLESEIKDLSTNIRRLQKMEDSMADVSASSSRLAELKAHLEDLNRENRSLKSNLTSKQTEMVLIKSQMAQLRHEFVEKCGDLQSEKEALISHIQEQENLNHQLQLLYDANSKLHDTNDALRSTIHSKQQLFRQCNIRSPSPVSPAGSASHSRHHSIASTPGGSMRANAKHSQQLDALRAAWATKDSNETDEDSGLARLSDAGTWSGLEVFPGASAGRQVESDFSSLEDDGPPSARSLSRSSARDTSPQYKPVLPRFTHIDIEPTGPPERTFRVVLAGDAGVGKSSLIMRLVKGNFINNLPSTLGVDFHVKSLHVDNKNVAIQLWDTAGQERFRSMCKNYFRRADGAFLVYDVTSESSFISVRDWMTTLDEAVQKRIPIVLCGNKADARVERAAEGGRCVTEEEGRKAAKAHAALFMETSAKCGTNVQAAILEMARELLANEDIEVQSTALVLNKPASKEPTSRCLCK